MKVQEKSPWMKTNTLQKWCQKYRAKCFCGNPALRRRVVQGQCHPFRLLLPLPSCCVRRSVGLQLGERLCPPTSVGLEGLGRPAISALVILFPKMALDIILRLQMQFKATIESIFWFAVQTNFIVHWKVNKMDKTDRKKDYLSFYFCQRSKWNPNS